MHCKRLAIGSVLCAVLCCAAGRAAAQEASEAEKKVENRLRALYGDGRTRKPLAKPKAHKKHDRVTFVINEQITARHEATTDVERESDMNWSLTKWFTLRVDDGGNLIAVPRLQTTNDNDNGAKSGQQKPEVTFSTDRTHSGEGEVTRTSNLSDEVSGEVLDVLPNGQMVVQARKRIKVDGEETQMTLTGRVDPKDLTAESKVDSKLVMDMCVKFEGKGDIRDMTRRGWVAKILDKLNPF